MKIKIIAVSDSDKHFWEAIQEYIKRMWRNLTIENIKPVKHGTVKQIITKETDTIIAKLKKLSWYKILLSKEWKQLTTEKVVYTIHGTSAVTIIIWWPYGLDEKKLASHIDSSISFGMQTMPHGLAKLVLLEQLYRVQTIIGGKKYHY
jgi:23S rRNA (pseudouridine1915-N3)-methyltransferase